jgi:predicted dehydrogenase
VVLVEVMEITRRTFSRRVAVAGALAPLASYALGQDAGNHEGNTGKLRFAIIGLGRISLQHFMPGCLASKKAQVTALVSGHREKADKYAAQYGVSAKNIYDYRNFDEIASNTEVDAVYVALPNSMHAEYTIRAANAGKHVLCEKPMAVSLRESQAMINACRAAGKKLMIAYRCQYEPTNLRAIAMIRDGKLGKIQAIESANGFNEKMGEWRLNRKLAGGGPLMDVGVYSLNACRFLTGEEPQSMEAYCSVIDKDGRFSDVEENVGWTMRFPSGVVASCNTTYGANMPGFVRVHGSLGVLHLEPAFSYEGIRIRAEIHGEAPIDDTNPAKDPAQFTTQADYFADCVEQNREPRSNGEEGLRDMQYMAQIYKSCGRSLG